MPELGALFRLRGDLKREVESDYVIQIMMKGIRKRLMKGTKVEKLRLLRFKGAHEVNELR